MKNTLISCIAVMFFLNNFCLGQQAIDPMPFTSVPSPIDSLIVERQDGKKIILVWPYTKNVKKRVAWEQLLDDFQADFGKVVNDIPVFDFYSIKYSQKKNLVVDEVRGKETYTVNESNGLDYVKSNICYIRGGKIRLTVEFNDKQELLDPSLRNDIKDAIANVKNKFYISMVSPERHYFDVKSAKMLKNPKPKLEFFIPVGAKLGVLKNEPYIELRPGLGVKVDKKFYVALNYNLMTQYERERDRTAYDGYIGLTTGTIGAGFGSEVAFRVKSGIALYDNLIYRAGINYRTRSGLQVGVDYYVKDPNRFDEKIEYFFGFNVGIAF